MSLGAAAAVGEASALAERGDWQSLLVNRMHFLQLVQEIAQRDVETCIDVMGLDALLAGPVQVGVPPRAERRQPGPPATSMKQRQSASAPQSGPPPPRSPAVAAAPPAELPQRSPVLVPKSPAALGGPTTLGGPAESLQPPPSSGYPSLQSKESITFAIPARQRASAAEKVLRTRPKPGAIAVGQGEDVPRLAASVMDFRGEPDEPARTPPRSPPEGKPNPPALTNEAQGTDSSPILPVSAPGTHEGPRSELTDDQKQQIASLVARMALSGKFGNRHPHPQQPPHIVGQRGHRAAQAKVGKGSKPGTAARLHPRAALADIGTSPLRSPPQKTLPLPPEAPTSRTVGTRTADTSGTVEKRDGAVEAGDLGAWLQEVEEHQQHLLQVAELRQTQQQLLRSLEAMERDEDDVIRRLETTERETRAREASKEAAEEVKEKPTAANRTAKAPRTRRRCRGAIPPEMLESIEANKGQVTEYVRFTEKLWNSSTVSQYTFATRITNGLFTALCDEVIGEVMDVLDRYVEGLVEFELE